MLARSFPKFFSPAGSRNRTQDEPSRATLRVQVVGCSNLFTESNRGLSDPFVAVTLGQTQTVKTPVARKTLNPVYDPKDTTFNFPIVGKTIEALKFVVWDKDWPRKDCLGEATVDFEDWFQSGDSQKSRPFAWSVAETQESFSIPLTSTKSRTTSQAVIQLRLGFVKVEGRDKEFKEVQDQLSGKSSDQHNETKNANVYGESPQPTCAEASLPPHRSSGDTSGTSAPISDKAPNLRPHDADHEEGEDDNKDQPFPLMMLQKEIRAFSRQRSKLNETELKKIDGQELLDKWQRMIISDIAGGHIPPADKTAILDAMIQLSSISGLSPKCLRIQDVGIQSPVPCPDIRSEDVQCYKGKIGALDVAVTVPKKHPEPGGEQLKTRLQQAILWRKLTHRNILPFLGLYYFDDSRTQVCLLSPWKENSATQHDFKQPEEGVRGIADGLAYLHDQNVFHGYLSTSSILIDSGDTPLIGEIGLAQLLGKAVDVKEDIYQFGRISFELFGGTSLKGKDGPPRPLGMSDTLWEVVKRCLNPTASSRPVASGIVKALTPI
ncbi:hypothetical protein PQX77_000337 [Marasmius sp. AFHP31]|nr:hypothetical protein PQX77_000337 [Marasmius sp. AFHP31]